MKNVVKKLDFELLLPLYKDNVFDDIQATMLRYGKSGLSKSEKKFLKYYVRLDSYLSALSNHDYDELLNAVLTKNKKLIHKHAKFELKYCCCK